MEWPSVFVSQWCSIKTGPLKLAQYNNIIPKSTDIHFSLDSEEDFCSSCRNKSDQKQLFTELTSTLKQAHITQKLHVDKKIDRRQNMGYMLITEVFGMLNKVMITFNMASYVRFKR